MHNSRRSKGRCFNGFGVAPNMLKPALWSPLEPAWDSEVTPLLDPKVILGVATGQQQVPPGDHLMTSQRSRCPGNEIVCRTGASSNRFCPVSFRHVLLAPTSCRAQNAPCFSFLERLLFWFSADRRGEAPAGCRRVYSHRFTHEFPRRAKDTLPNVICELSWSILSDV